MTSFFKPDFTKTFISRDSGEDAPEVSMELVPHPKKEFMKKFERYEPLVKDSTAIQALKKCPRLFFYQIVLGRVANNNAIVLVWGSAYHKFREVLEETYGIGTERPVRFDKEKAQQAFAEGARAGLNYFQKNARPIPVGDKFEFMTLPRLIESFKVAYAWWEREKQQGQIEVVASEQPFTLMIKDGSYIGGRADQLVRWHGKLWGRDFKTTTKDSAFYARGIDPNDQFTRYTLADSMLTGEPVQGQIVELLYNNKHTKTKKHGPEIIPLTTTRTVEQLEKFEDEQRVINRTLEIYREEDVWPMHEASCAFCPYHSVCTKSTEAGMMAQLEQNFNVRPWDFNKVGNDDY